ncbi:MAG TPA: acyltransferase [Fimbriimonas sp.]
MAGVARGTRPSANLDLIRGIAAIAVLLGHWRYLFFADFREVTAPGLGTKFFYFLTGFGHESVMVFFVLSGYLVGTSVRSAVGQGRWSWSSYASARLGRLYTVLIPALLIGGTLDFAGASTLGSAGVYAGADPFRAMLPAAPQTQLGTDVLMANLAFLQTVQSPTFGSNSPLWSLANEFWYYVLFPILLLSARPRVELPARLLGLACAFLILAFVGFEIGSLFLIWLMGAAVGDPLANKALGNRASLWAAGGALALSLIASRFGLLFPRMAGDLLVGSCAALWVGSVAWQADRPCRSWTRSLAAYLSNRSYTAYLFHVPALVLLNGFLLGDQPRWSFTGYSLGAGIGVLAAVWLYIELMWRAFESRTTEVRAWIASVRLSRRVPA